MTCRRREPTGYGEALTSNFVPSSLENEDLSTPRAEIIPSAGRVASCMMAKGES